MIPDLFQNFQGKQESLSIWNDIKMEGKDEFHGITTPTILSVPESTIIVNIWTFYFLLHHDD